MSGILEGKVAIVTGAGRGLGRAHALELARQGAKVVVNDLGASNHGEGTSDGPANEVASLIRDMGGEAVVNGADVADWSAAKAMIDQAIDAFGRLDIVVNKDRKSTRLNSSHVRISYAVFCLKKKKKKKKRQ